MASSVWSSSRAVGHADEMTIGQRLWAIHWPLMIVALAISGIGIATLYSISGGNFDPWAARQINRIILALVLCFIVAVLPMRFWLHLANPLYLGALMLLMLVPVFGTVSGGARRWLSLGGVSVQPAEIMKVAIILVLARYYQWLAPKRTSQLPFVLVPVLLILLPFLMVASQPDLGTAILIAAIGAGMLYVAGISILYFLSAGLAAAAAFPYAWERMHDYQKERILVFLDPERDPLGKGYQVFQSQIALGSGGFSGKGFGKGTQSQLSFLPERHTDFIFTTFAEEMGFFGSAMLIALFALLFVFLVIMVMRSKSTFARLVIAGVGLDIFLHVAVNISMVMGLAPVVGLPLPLMSYGGTSMFVTFAALGLAMNAHIHARDTIRTGAVGPFL